MIHEYTAGSFTIYNQILREVKDDYTARKVIKDRKKLRIWLINLLNDRDVIMFYKDSGEEKIVFMNGQKPVITQNLWEGPMPVPDPVIPEGEDKLNYITGYEINSKNPVVIHLDNITKFIVKSENIIALSNTINYYDEIYN